MKLFDLFIDLLPASLTMLLIKNFLVLILTGVLLILVKAIWMKFYKSEDPFPVKSGIVQLLSIVTVAVLINIYWFFIIKTNGILLFTWASFPMGFNNIYLMLSPLLTSYLFLVILYFRTQANIQKLL